MTIVVNDRVVETTTTTGTSTLSLGGAVQGYQSAVVGIGSGNQSFFCETDGINYEIFLGTVTAGTPNTLSKDAIIMTSAGNTTPLSWGAGQKTVLSDIPAKYLPYMVGARDLSTFPVGSYLSMVAGGGFDVAGPLQGHKNLLIGGDFSVNPWARGTSIGPLTANSAVYTADRWQAWLPAGGSSITYSYTASTPPFKGRLRCLRTSGNTVAGFQGMVQTIEISNARQLAGQNVTLSFWAIAGAGFSAASSLLQAAIFYGTGTSDVSVKSTGFTSQSSSTQNFTLTTTLTQYQMTVTVPAGTTQLAVRFGYTSVGTAAANDYFEIAEVQLERGSIATNYEYRSVGVEALLCQRYYYGTQGSFNAGFFWGDVTSGRTYYAIYDLPVPMRVVPTVAGTIFGSATNFSNAAVGTLSATYTYVAESRVANATGGGGTFGSQITADAEIY